MQAEVAPPRLHVHVFGARGAGKTRVVNTLVRGGTELLPEAAMPGAVPVHVSVNSDAGLVPRIGACVDGVATELDAVRTALCSAYETAHEPRVITDSKHTFYALEESAFDFDVTDYPDDAHAGRPYDVDAINVAVIVVTHIHDVLLAVDSSGELLDGILFVQASTRPVSDMEFSTIQFPEHVAHAPLTGAALEVQLASFITSGCVQRIGTDDWPVKPTCADRDAPSSEAMSKWTMYRARMFSTLRSIVGAATAYRAATAAATARAQTVALAMPCPDPLVAGTVPCVNARVRERMANAVVAAVADARSLMANNRYAYRSYARAVGDAIVAAAHSIEDIAARMAFRRALAVELGCGVRLDVTQPHTVLDGLARAQWRHVLLPSAEPYAAGWNLPRAGEALSAVVGVTGSATRARVVASAMLEIVVPWLDALSIAVETAPATRAAVAALRAARVECVCAAECA